jgi:hypothetical protein
MRVPFRFQIGEPGIALGYGKGGVSSTAIALEMPGFSVKSVQTHPLPLSDTKNPKKSVGNLFLPKKLVAWCGLAV